MRHPRERMRNGITCTHAKKCKNTFDYYVVQSIKIFFVLVWLLFLSSYNGMVSKQAKHHKHGREILEQVSLGEESQAALTFSKREPQISRNIESITNQNSNSVISPSTTPLVCIYLLLMLIPSINLPRQLTIRTTQSDKTNNK